MKKDKTNNDLKKEDTILISFNKKRISIARTGLNQYPCPNLLNKVMDILEEENKKEILKKIKKAPSPRILTSHGEIVVEYRYVRIIDHKEFEYLTRTLHKDRDKSKETILLHKLGNNYTVFFLLCGLLYCYSERLKNPLRIVEKQFENIMN